MNASLNKIQLLLVVAFSLSCVSCKKFLSAHSQYDSFINTATDAEELLVGDGYIEYFSSLSSPILFEMDDDVSAGIPASTNRMGRADGYYKWKANPRIDSEGVLTSTDSYYTQLYLRISRLNAVIGSVSDLRKKGEQSTSLNKIEGEAYFLRAYYYYFLVNTYGKPYKETTADIDFGVPLKTEAAIMQQFATRSSVKKVYDQIVADLQLADQLLRGFNEQSAIRANQSAVYALLSRVFLYMENYEQVVYYADLVIKNKKNTLVDLNQPAHNSIFLNIHSPEVLFTMGNGTYFDNALSADIPVGHYYIPSDELLSVFENNDLRKQQYFLQNSKGDWRFGKKKNTNRASMEAVGQMFLLRLSEIYLNKAEALAALGRSEDATGVVQAFRKNRFKPMELPAVEEDGANLVNFIREERRRELFLEGHRWFDLRRYAVNTRFPYTKITRHRNITFTGTKYMLDGYYELGTYDSEPSSYVIPLAVDEIQFNQGLLKNEDRPERSLQH